MRVSRLFGKTFKETPHDAELPNHRFLLRAGFIRQYTSGIFALLPLGQRSIRKIENIIREEMEGIGSQEISMSGLCSSDIWEESGRYEAIDESMFRLVDRKGQKMVLNMTHEEPMVHLARQELSSYKQLPLSAFQIQTKFRDEARPRGGLIRLREFTMKDAYSFHSSEECLEKTYQSFYQAYNRIFKRAGCRNFVAVESDNGMFGGQYSHEFTTLTPSGEDTILVCGSCGYKANKEVASTTHSYSEEEPEELSEIETPGAKTINDLANQLGVGTDKCGKAVLFETCAEEPKLVIGFVRGDRDIMNVKIENTVGSPLRPAADSTIRSHGAVPGYTGPMALDLERITIVVDHSAARQPNLVVGANKEGYHVKGFNFDRDLLSKLGENDSAKVLVADITAVEKGDACPKCGASIDTTRGIEIGNIFHLGAKYSKALKCTYLDESGKSQFPIMGCYGLGVTRLLAALAEEFHDDAGLMLPMAVAPYQVYLSAIKVNSPEVLQAAERLYESLTEAGVEVLFDDRKVGPGFKFKDADLIGIPIQLVISPKTLEAGSVEFKLRGVDAGASLVPVEEVQQKVADEIKKQLSI